LQQTAATQPSDTAQTPESAPASTPAVAPPSDFTPDSPAQPAVSPESSIGNPKE
jgi:hypothetical protein